MTCTIEQPFGSAVVAPGAGFMLNNEFTDFSAPGTVNEPEGAKLPRSSMSPTIVLKGKRPVLVASGTGGVNIIRGVVQTILNVIELCMDLAHAVDAERIEAAFFGPILAVEGVRIPRVSSTS